MANSNKTRLDANQCIVNSFDGVEEAQRQSVVNPEIIEAAQNNISSYDSVNSSQRVSIVNSVEYEIQLDAEDGDSVKSFKNTITVCNISVSSSGGSPVTSAEIDCSMYSSFCVYSNINGNPAATGYALVQGTCGTTGSNWHDVCDPIYAGKRPPAASTSVDATDKRGSSGVIELASKRMRLYVPVAGKPSSGTVEYSIVLRS